MAILAMVCVSDTSAVRRQFSNRASDALSPRAFWLPRTVHHIRYNPPVTSERVINVELSNHSYPIIVQPGSLRQIGAILRARSAAAKAAIITDSHVAAHFLPAARQSLTQAGFAVIEAVIPAGENHKTFSDLLPVFDRILESRIDRQTPSIALGGGVVGDMAGFVAATVLRGVPFVQVPTSLLAMVDASVGGKTGVNHATGKNLIGAFHQPIAVCVDPAVLTTLPERELRGGLAECIKHDLIRDADGFAHLERDIHRALALDIDYLSDLIAHNVAIKARVVESDPFEKGDRAHLNFGHTFGHAIESVSKYEYSHGESVALGMVAATNLCVSLNLLDQADRERIVAVIDKAGLPTSESKLDTDDLLGAMAFDKKVKSGRLRFVLLERIGKATVRDDVPLDLVRKALQDIRP
jgi:3-dehydroquinate synthase